MSKNQEFVKFDKVDKSYDGKVLVVKDLNLDIAEGEFITMLGPSGSGKTTCLMMLAGFETPTNGEIYLDANPISNIPPHKRGIGMVFQNYALFPHMTVCSPNKSVSTSSLNVVSIIPDLPPPIAEAYDIARSLALPDPF